ncbi:MULTISPECIES: hypothetical protein [unclassified Halomonas]|uniref:hypothetical protein n=1 Tax=unclassified Halomonas TaxID=2609666 RepID=UPI0006DBB1A6|nr:MULTISPECIES: hypothetical protein [unclassified Halomonas]KPQ22191.1 MAG: hypothetical protein HLUCCO06_12715 [Halomonas sp. HL-93]SBR49479.1 hypothetical protein GA0071314_2221 [Halomonas sp. HL-93]SNY96392.1 hypothetical protein SAMN04488142_0930 [Halomonas sp. hl-4]
MTRNFRLEKNDSDDIGFAKASLVSGVLKFSEFKQWLYYVIEHQDQVPAYFWDILDIENKFDFKPFSVMGFNPSWEHTESESDALDGIGYRRWNDFLSDAVPREVALQELDRNPHVEKRFRETFPFIDW